MTEYRRFLFFTSIGLLLVIFASCRSAKYLEDGQSLVTDIDMQGIPSELKEQASQYVSNEIRPNSALNLSIYNLFNTKDGRYKKEKIRQVGEEPHVLDSSLVELSSTQIGRFLQTKGYFNAEVKPTVSTKGKKSKITFEVELGSPYYIGDISYDFEDQTIGAIYDHQVKPTTAIVRGEQYDMQKLLVERENLYVSAKDLGYFDYLRQYMRIGIDTNQVRHQADLSMSILRPDTTDQTAYYIQNVYLTIKKGEPAQAPVFVYDSLSRINFADETGHFRLKPIARYTFLRSGQLYSLKNENLSYDRLYEMNGFRSVRINYEKESDNLLNVYYELMPRSVMANQIEGEYTFSSGMSGFNVGNTFSHRNIFGGSELLEVKLRYGVLFDPRLEGSLGQKIFNNDFQVGVNLTVPRLLLPFGVRNVGKYGLPRTTLSSSLQLFNQDQTYSNRYFINTLNYSWWQSSNLQHSYTPLVLEYRVGRLDKTFRENLEKEGYSLYVESNDREYFGLGSQYAITLNALRLLKLENFSYFKGSLDVSGNTLGILSTLFNFRENSSGEKLLFNVPYLQYIKGEVDYRWYRYLGGHRQVVARFNGGLAVPYGNNSKLLIFEKSFFAGGMNGIRAWQARTLGPGSYNREVLPEDLRLNLRNLDQLGEVKIEANFEYRFRLLDNFLGTKMNGATFIDMGNIWRLRSDERIPRGEFKLDKMLGQVAIGGGFGLRFDMDYFVLRLDAGLKMKDPQFEGNDQWVVQHWFRSKDFKREYYSSHRPDRYNFVQYNFGVGLPF
ncbi:BamA/TamA family outer membrane protein [Parapedobacter sp. SGR-10]|nr:BamA/TamA family outer membrane protein [Parapedobacter sp. SGR-10]